MRLSKIIKNNFSEIVLLFIVFYLLVAFIPPFAYQAGNEKLAVGIHNVYHFFCHQRVERSPFLFGEDGSVNFYSIEELQERGAIPKVNPYVPASFSEEIFGHKYYGNSDVGYKVALCIRDIALYVGMITTGAIYLLKCRIDKKIYKINWKLSILMMVPLVLDVFVQIAGRLLDLPFVTDEYIASISKRVITGVIFGIGFGLLIFSNLKDSTKDDYNVENNEKSNN